MNKEFKKNSAVLIFALFLTFVFQYLINETKTTYGEFGTILFMLIFLCLKELFK